MKNYLISISDELSKEIESTMKRWGFVSKNEFFRFTAIDFIRNDARLMPSDEVLEQHTKAIKSVKARQKLTEDTRSWKKNNPHLTADMG